MKAIFHIGYPKTATTFLQKRVFPTLKRYQLITSDRVTHSVIQELITEGNSTILEKLDRPFLLSDEGLAVAGGALEIPGPARKDLLKNLSVKFPDAKILVTIRSQERLLHSFYIQKIDRIRGSYGNWISDQIRLRESGYLQFFDYHVLHQELSRYFHSDNICYMPLERIANGLEAVEELSLFFEDEINLSQIDPSPVNVMGTRVKSFSRFRAPRFNDLVRVRNMIRYKINKKPQRKVDEQVVEYFEASNRNFRDCVKNPL